MRKRRVRGRCGRSIDASNECVVLEMFGGVGEKHERVEIRMGDGALLSGEDVGENKEGEKYM